MGPPAAAPVAGAVMAASVFVYTQQTQLLASGLVSFYFFSLSGKKKKVRKNKSEQAGKDVKDTVLSLGGDGAKKTERSEVTINIDSLVWKLI